MVDFRQIATGDTATEETVGVVVCVFVVADTIGRSDVYRVGVFDTPGTIGAVDVVHEGRQGATK